MALMALIGMFSRQRTSGIRYPESIFHVDATFEMFRRRKESGATGDEWLGDGGGLRAWAEPVAADLRQPIADAEPSVERELQDGAHQLVALGVPRDEVERYAGSLLGGFRLSD